MKFILLTHERELNKSTNTGRLVKQVLQDDAEIIIWKRKEPDRRLVNLLEQKLAALLFMVDGTDTKAMRISNYHYCVVLDATWQEARKMYNQSQYLKSADMVSINSTKLSEFKLRRNQVEGGLSTVECVIDVLNQQRFYHKSALLKAAFEAFNI